MDIDVTSDSFYHLTSLLASKYCSGYTIVASDYALFEPWGEKYFPKCRDNVMEDVAFLLRAVLSLISNATLCLVGGKK